MRALLALVLLLASFPAAAGIVTGVIDSNTLQIDLTSKIRIAGILAPPATVRALRAVLLNQLVTLGNNHTDARGVTSATVLRASGDDVAQQLVATGLARAYPLPGQDDLALQKLLQLEDAARQQKTGLWNDAAFAVQPPEAAGKLLDSYGIVEGTVAAAASVKGRYYLNFGPDWKTDFTAQLTKEAVTALALSPYRINWTQLGGQRVRVRGWVEPRNGPMITISSPAQLEIVK